QVCVPAQPWTPESHGRVAPAVHSPGHEPAMQVWPLAAQSMVFQCPPEVQLVLATCPLQMPASPCAHSPWHEPEMHVWLCAAQLMTFQNPTAPHVVIATGSLQTPA